MRVEDALRGHACLLEFEALELLLARQGDVFVQRFLDDLAPRLLPVSVSYFTNVRLPVRLDVLIQARLPLGGSEVLFCYRVPEGLNLAVNWQPANAAASIEEPSLYFLEIV